jgi:hypothetical protein
MESLKNSFFEEQLSIEKMAKKFGIGHNTLRAKVNELQWNREPLPKPAGPDHPSYKGVSDRGVSLFETYGPRLEQLGEKVRPDTTDSSLLNVRCYYSGCRRWYRPIVSTVVSRIAALEGRVKWGQNNFYCSDSCKERCAVYGRTQFQCKGCGLWFTGLGPQRYCDECSTARPRFSPSTKAAIHERDLKLGWVNEDSEYQIHHILSVAEFPDWADEEWNGWALDMKSELHSIIHNVCGLAKRDIACVDERYFELAINKLKENNAPQRVIELCIKIYEGR